MNTSITELNQKICMEVITTMKLTEMNQTDHLKNKIIFYYNYEA